MLDKISDNDIKRADEEVLEINSQVLNGQLADPVLVYQKCEELWNRGGFCAYKDFALKTGNTAYCEYASLQQVDRRGGAAAAQYAAQCKDDVLNRRAGN